MLIATGGQFLAMTTRNRHLARIAIGAVHDQQIPDPAHDEQLTVGEETQITGSQPGPFGCSGRANRKPGAEGPLGLLRLCQ